jgi:hypothetical protein
MEDRFSLVSGMPEIKAGKSLVGMQDIRLIKDG